MSFDTFIPELWEAKLDVPYQGALVYNQPGIADREYEGTIREKGDTVSINRLITGDVKDYQRGVPIVSDTLSTEDTKLHIDAQKYTAFDVEDIDKVQAAGAFQETALADYGYKMATEADQYSAKKMSEGAGTKLGTIKVFDGSDYHVPTSGQATAWDVVRLMRAEFDKRSIPKENRWMVVGGDFASSLLADRRITDAAHAGDNTILLNGEVSARPVLGFRITVSPNAPVTAGRELIIAGVKGGYNFASQLTKTEAYRSHEQFADTFRTLNVWGGAATREDRLFTISPDVKPGTLPSFGSPVTEPDDTGA